MQQINCHSKSITVIFIILFIIICYIVCYMLYIIIYDKAPYLLNLNYQCLNIFNVTLLCEKLNKSVQIIIS